MRFRDFLKLEGIKIHLKAIDKKEVIEKLVDTLVETYHLNNRQEVLTSVLEREALMSTGVGKGVAIPHGKVDSVQEVIGSMVILDSGVDFEAPDGAPVEMAILLVASAKETGPHIRALAHISRVLQDEKVRQGLVSSLQPKEVFEILERKEKEL
ncbi:MAG: PTS sugar transporter subunit IIA [Chlamydiae bacterium]|nr:PTS sugar transporter subunit IIA [Chlamydiota bacterium]MBI3277579.1 PTS sugar transporter subunit IIA [Chlamydiota bacterium]